MSAGKGKGKTRGGGGGGGGGGGSGGISSKDSASQRRSRSRNTTPASTTVSENTLMSGELSMSPQASYSDILDKYVTGGDTSIPASVTLTALASDLRALSSSAARQAATCKARMSELSEQVHRKQAEERERKERDDDDRVKKKRDREDRDRRKAKHKYDSKHPPTHGAHQLTSQAPPDVMVNGEPSEKAKKRKSESPLDERPRKYSRSPSISSTSSKSDRQPTPIPPTTVYDYFENDNTIYHIEDVTEETLTEERNRIYQVAAFPTKDLSDLQPGEPPDMDFTNAKPQNQVAHATYTAYTEPYFRNFTEEDLAFLRERVSTSEVSHSNHGKWGSNAGAAGGGQGDRVSCYVIPPLGPHYSEVWAQEETPTLASSAPPQLTNGVGPKGGPDSISDDILEKEDVSLGPLMSRILAGMVIEDAAGEEANGEDEKNPSSSSTLPGFQDPSWKAAGGRSSYAAFEEAMKREMKYIGLWEPNEGEPDWSAHNDDEISARLRALQRELRKQSILNGARKARLTQMLKDQLAYQEYATILEDLDKQVEQAYTKRTRTIKPKKKKVVPNGPGVGQARLGIGDQARTLMERRKRWKELIGAVFEENMTRIPRESIFQNLEELERIEELGGLEEEQ